jgi:glycosyltransferase involved in cell wall biosynthesis
MHKYRERIESGRSSSFEMVWIGSSSTLLGLERRSEMLERIGREVPNSRLRVIADRFPRFEALGVIGVEWSETSEVKELGRGDVGIAWVPDDLWSRGKCGLKVLQYMASGLPVLANPVGVHGEMVLHGETGILAETEDEWVDAARWMASDGERRREMGRLGCARVLERYSVNAWSREWVSTISAGSLGVIDWPGMQLAGGVA